VRTLNGATIDGQQIKVDIAKQREDRGGGGGGGKSLRMDPRGTIGVRLFFL
jgi:hypothetical protein